MKGKFSNKTVIGLVAIVIGLVISFIITPMLQSKQSEKVKIIRVAKEIEVGQQITQEMLEVSDIERKYLNHNIVQTKEEVVGKYPKVKLYKSESILKDKIRDSSKGKDSYLDELEGKSAISISIQGLAQGLSNKLTAGDIVRIIITDKDENTILLEDLKYVKLLSTTTSSGLDIQEEQKLSDGTEDNLAATATLLVNDRQALTLSSCEAGAKIHLALVFRGSELEAKKLLEKQEDIIKKLEKQEELEEKQEQGKEQPYGNE